MCWPSLSSGSLRPSAISENAPCDRQEYLGRKSVWLVRLGDREGGKHRVLVLSEIFEEFQSLPHLPECQKGRNKYEPILNPWSEDDSNVEKQGVTTVEKLEIRIEARFVMLSCFCYVIIVVFL